MADKLPLCAQILKHAPSQCNGSAATLGEDDGMAERCAALEAASYFDEGKAYVRSSIGGSTTPTSASGVGDSSDIDTLANEGATDASPRSNDRGETQVDSIVNMERKEVSAQAPLLLDPLDEFHAVHARCSRRWRQRSAERRGCRIAEMKSEVTACMQLLQQGSNSHAAQQDPVAAMKVKMDLYRQRLAKRQQSAPTADQPSPPRAECAQDTMAAMRAKMGICKQILAGEGLQRALDQQRAESQRLREELEAAMADKLHLCAKILKRAPSQCNGSAAPLGEDDGMAERCAALEEEVRHLQAENEILRDELSSIRGSADGGVCTTTALASIVAVAAATAALARMMAALRA